ncbi:MAG: 5-(carboxyamino)imidazole ribonucleotide synthase [Armatimonadetes bacterium]|nr:5-(carboxyamino)imidazole ribonucleotide synthase [Armatimonadota bacterium]
MLFDLGFLGGGQLARMSIQAAQRMGLRCMSIDPQEGCPASQIAACIQAPLNDVDALAELLRNCYRVTLENEFVPAASLRQALSQAERDESMIIPGLDTLEIIQDKLKQRERYAKAGIPSPKAVAIEDDGAMAIARIKFPMVLKARFGGYDGRGTRYVQSSEDFEDLRSLWDDGGWLAEEYVPFKRELAVMVFRSAHGVGAFPTMETIQTNHVCDLVFPAESDATEIAVNAVESVEGIGLFGVELFQTSDGKILVNEIAPRPHNAGHYTLDWGGASQFDQHVRLVLGLPTIPLDGVPVCMANLLGIENVGPWRKAMMEMLAEYPDVRLHWYGKEDIRPGRKLGHINAVGAGCLERAKAARTLFLEQWRAVQESGHSR